MSEMILAAGGDIKATQDGVAPSILHEAVARGLKDWVIKALDAGIDVNAKTKDNERTPLMSAYDPPEIARILIERGADVNVADKNGAGSLYFAVSRKMPPALEVMEILLKSGADPNSSKNNPLASALGGFSDRWNESSSSFWPEAAELLLKNGADPRVGNVLTVEKRLLPLGEEASRLYDLCWQWVYLEHNPHRKNAIWFDQRPEEFRTIGGGSGTIQPGCVAFVGRDGGAEKNSLADVMRMDRFSGRELNPVVIRRLSKDGEPDQILTVNFLSYILEGDESQNPDLAFGDVISPAEELADLAPDVIDKVSAWYTQPRDIDVRIELGEKQIISNSTDGTSTFRLMTLEPLEQADVLRLAGDASYLFGGVAELWRTDYDTGNLKQQTNDGVWVRHGDLIRVSMPVPKPALSDAVLNVGRFVTTPDGGAFWPITEDVPNIAVLALALSSPNGLPFGPIDLAKSKIRRRNADSWVESSLVDSLSEPLVTHFDEKSRPLGFHIVTAPLKDESFQLSPETQKTLSDLLSFNWNLWIDDLPPAMHHYQPYFFSARRSSGIWKWRSNLESTSRSTAALLPDMHILRWSIKAELPQSPYVIERGGKWIDLDAARETRPGIIVREPREGEKPDSNGVQSGADAAAQIRRMLQQRDTEKNRRRVIESPRR
ncbi:MAG: ankyrin repeat domain-containing protein [Verrucomicrobiales bacterium]